MVFAGEIGEHARNRQIRRNISHKVEEEPKESHAKACKKERAESGRAVVDESLVQVVTTRRLTIATGH